jgi:hypothetical protein
MGALGGAVWLAHRGKVNMRQFPDGLIADYRDSAGTCSIPFNLQNGKYNWEIPLRDTTLYGDELEEIVEQIPEDGALRFTVPLPFRSIKGGNVCVVIPITVSAWWIPTHKRAGKDVHCQCGCEIGGEEYCSAAVCNADLETALQQLHNKLWPVGHPEACFFCKFSDYEPNTTIGHLACFVRRKGEYCTLAASEDSMVRKYHIWSLRPYQWVDEFHRCDQFEEPPDKWGYRG